MDMDMDMAVCPRLVSLVSFDSISLSIITKTRGASHHSDWLIFPLLLHYPLKPFQSLSSGLGRPPPYRGEHSFYLVLIVLLRKEPPKPRSS